MNRVEKIRKRIVLARTAKGYTQDYLGEQLHMSQISYHKLENGKTGLKVKTLIDLAVILEVKESYLLGCDE
jgi:transcriptional regulator with XRE-family HTH domain